MGTWGTGIFDNDDASDWLYGLRESRDLSLITETLETVTKRSQEYIETADCANALAAAEVVAALKGAFNPKLSDEVRQWVTSQQPISVSAQATEALKAIERIKDDSELKVLWDESSNSAEWYSALSDLEIRLKQ